jgi:HSP20 family molecular chaperone IbpA
MGPLRVFLTIMKLRIRGNSLRLRITRPELEQLASGRPVIERLTFGAGAQLRYELNVDATAAALEATYNDGVIRVRIPAAEFRRWQSEDQVALSVAQATGEDSELTLLVEKDFPCLTPRTGEDDSAAFAHPAGPKAC